MIRRAHAAGFSLVEVMVAVIIIAIGMLGIAKLHALTIASTSTARLRSLAAIEAASLASAMHSDRAYWATAGNPPATVTISGTTITASDAALSNKATPCTSEAGGARPFCDGPHLAAYDLQTWAATLAELLPNDTAKIVCSASVIGAPSPTPAPVFCTIQIGWTESTVAANSQEAAQAGAPAPFQTPSYVLYVEP